MKTAVMWSISPVPRVAGNISRHLWSPPVSFWLGPISPTKKESQNCRCQTPRNGQRYKKINALHLKSPVIVCVSSLYFSLSLLYYLYKHGNLICLRLGGYVLHQFHERLPINDCFIITQFLHEFLIVLCNLRGILRSCEEIVFFLNLV